MPVLIIALLLLPWPWGSASNGLIFPWGFDMAGEADFTIASTGWATSGTADASSTGFTTVGADWTHSTYGGVNSIEHAGGSLSVVNPIAEATITAFFNEAATDSVYDFEFGFYLRGKGATASDFNSFLFWLGGTHTVSLRHLGTDGHLNADGSPNAVRLFGNTGTHRNGSGYIFMPTDTIMRGRYRVTETSGTYTVEFFVNDELITKATGLALSAANAGRMMEFRSPATGTGDDDLTFGLTGPFVGEEDPGTTIRPTTSLQTDTRVRAFPVPMLTGSGWWTDSGTVTYGRDIDEGTVPNINHPMVLQATGSYLETAAEIGTPIVANNGAGTLWVAKVELSADTAEWTLKIMEAGSTDAYISILFDSDNVVYMGEGAETITYSAVQDSDGGNMPWESGENYEVAIQYAPGVKPTLVLHKRSATFTAEQTVWAGRLTACATTGVPTSLGKVRSTAAGTGTVDFSGIELNATHWAALSSSWTHSTGSGYGGSSHVVSRALFDGMAIGWGGEIPGLERSRDHYHDYCAWGRSGADFADWETNNPSWADLLPFLPATRLVGVDTMVNHLAAQRTNGTAAINTARDQVEAQVQRIIDAAKTSDVRVDGMDQFPMPVGEVGGLNYPQDVADAMTALNATLLANFTAAGRPDLFTWAPIITGKVESDFYTAATDDTHYDDDGDMLAYRLSESEKASVGTASTTRSRDRGRGR